MTPRLTTEQRRALELLARAGLSGATQALLMAHGFGAGLIAGLVDHRLATLTYETVRAGGRMGVVGKVRITNAGRDALADRGAPDSV